jgi:hypothetical protein
MLPICGRGVIISGRLRKLLSYPVTNQSSKNKMRFDFLNQASDVECDVGRRKVATCDRD